MKLDYKRVALVGFAFLLIQSFWQAYDAIVPLILVNKYGMNQTFSGVVMALDNALAVFMLPLFGAISDRYNSIHGRRTPFIFVGTILAVIFFITMSLVNNLWLFIFLLLWPAGLWAFSSLISILPKYLWGTQVLWPLAGPSPPWLSWPIRKFFC